MSVAILADDLTGALDAAAPFARPASPVRVVRWGTWPDQGSIAIDSGTRDADENAATREVCRLLPALGGRNMAFKKIDSLLRGNTVAEIAACWDTGRFSTMIVAPAFPSQGRVTRNGRQYLAATTGWVETGPSLFDALRARDLPVQLCAPTGAGVFVCDAETDADLLDVVGEARATSILWCGSGGLAAALAGSPTDAVAPTGACRLIVIGTRHPVTLAQVAAASAAFPEAVIVIDDTATARSAMANLHRCLARRDSAVLVLDLVPQDQFAVLQRLSGDAPDVLIASGGATLARLCDSLGVNAIDAIGQWRSGFPVAQLTGGAWDGTLLVSKSGAFGGPQALIELMRGGTP